MTRTIRSIGAQATTRRAFLAGVAGLSLADTAAGRTSEPADSGRTPESTDTGSRDGRERDDAPGLDPEAVADYFDAELEARVGDETPGATVAVVTSDRTCFTEGYGVADVETGTPVRADETGFRVGSVSKLPTYTALLRSVERGRLDLDVDVNEYLTDSALHVSETFDEPVTLRHLSTHTPGFDAVPNPGLVWDPAAVTDLETALAEPRPERIRPPGKVVAYSNYGTALTGHVLAEAHDTTFHEVVDAEVLEPLEMDHTTYVQPVPEEYPGDVSRPHAPNGDHFSVADTSYVTWFPAGSMTATATDIARFMRAHLGRGRLESTRVLEPATADEMHRRQFERHPAVNGMAHGFWETGAPDEPLLGHGGSTMNFQSYLLLVPERDVGVFVAYNARGAGTPVSLVEAFARTFDLGFAAHAPDRRPPEGASERAEAVAGEYATVTEYRGALGETLTRLRNVRVDPLDDGRIRVRSLEEGAREFVEAEPYVFREVDGHDALAFEVDDGDAVRAHRSGTAVATYEPAEFAERQLVAGGTAGVALGGFLVSTVGWSGDALRRRWRRRTDDSAETNEEAGE